MNKTHLTALFTAASLSLISGCASGWPHSLSFSRTKPGSESTAEYKDDSSADETALSLLKRKPATGELSPEFKAAQKNFKNPEKSLLAWARYQEDIGEYAEARKKYRELQIAYPDNLDASVGLARIDMLTGRTRQAEDQLNALAKKHPKNGDIQTELGALYSRNEDFPKAIRAYQRACEIDPDNESYRYELGIALVKHGQYDEGLSHLAFAVGDSAAHYNIGYLLHEQGDDENAIEWFRNSLELHPDKQTAERAGAMLASLQSVERSSSGQAIARSASMKRYGSRTSPNGQSSVARMPPESTGHDMAAHDVATQQSSSGRARLSNTPTPLPTVEEEFLLSEANNRMQTRQGTPLPPANDSTALPQVSGSTNNRNNSAFRTVSWPGSQPTYSNPVSSAFTSSEIDEEGHSNRTAEPPQWAGPSRRSADSLISTPGTQNPPAWRARSGQ